MEFKSKCFRGEIAVTSRRTAQGHTSKASGWCVGLAAVKKKGARTKRLSLQCGLSHSRGESQSEDTQARILTLDRKGREAHVPLTIKESKVCAGRHWLLTVFLAAGTSEQSLPWLPQGVYHSLMLAQNKVPHAEPLGQTFRRLLRICPPWFFSYIVGLFFKTMYFRENAVR